MTPNAVTVRSHRERCTRSAVERSEPEAVMALIELIGFAALGGEKPTCVDRITEGSVIDIVGNDGAEGGLAIYPGDGTRSVLQLQML